MAVTKNIPTEKSRCRRSRHRGLTKKSEPSRIHDVPTEVVDIGTTLEKILGIKGAGEILIENGVLCLSCPMASFEIDKLKIGEVCKMYGLNLEKILKELNKKN